MTISASSSDPTTIMCTRVNNQLAQRIEAACDGNRSDGIRRLIEAVLAACESPLGDADVVLGVDLASASLPEAIAAMVEAWLNAQQVLA